MERSTIPTGFQDRHVDSLGGSWSHAPAPRRPGLDVSLVASIAGPLDARGPVVIARVGVGQETVRLYIYIDGDVAEAWTPAPGVAEFDARKIPPGRHVVTARAVDALGRWGGASVVVEVAEPSR
jgi:hypothetical protein